MTEYDLLRSVSTADLTTYARHIPSPADFQLTRDVFPKQRIYDVKWRIKNSGRYVNVAKYRAYDASVPFADREAWQTTREGMLPALGQKFLVTEQQTILLETSRGADDDELVKLLYDDVERHVEAIDSRLELAAGQVLITGRISLEGENGLTYEADFGVPEANVPTAAKPWSDATADPIADELRWLQYLDDLGVPAPEFVLTSRKAVSYLAYNNAYRAAFYGSVSPSATPTASLNPAQVTTVRENYGLPPVRFYRTQVRVDGQAVRVLPEDRFIYIPPDRTKWGQTLYGTTAESLLLSRGSNPQITREDAPGVIITAKVEDDAAQIYTKGAAVAMPVLHTPDAHLCAKVL
ncbi:major capsid protein [Streptomyces sp. B1866]|uniref:major capsid protein n=1 Tax=Streptomyces sp. B1866 TaxID=3075431 RepID=UPI00288EE7E7|nr:major capsid protein [Streptomyces sp. B1866]MDT3396333.1 major capsid protein [Streptomyces sp. B1866]